MTAAAPVLFLHALGGMRNGAFLRRFGTNSMRVAWLQHGADGLREMIPFW
jgi:hypothetical protein